MKPPPLRRLPSMRGTIALCFEILVTSFNVTLAGGTVWYTWRANRELPLAEAALHKAGYTLDAVKIAAPDVPDAENKGAVEPLLDIAARDEDQTPEIKLRIARLAELKMRYIARTDDEWKGETQRLLKDRTGDNA